MKSRDEVLVERAVAERRSRLSRRVARRLGGLAGRVLNAEAERLGEEMPPLPAPRETSPFLTPVQGEALVALLASKDPAYRDALVANLLDGHPLENLAGALVRRAPCLLATPPAAPPEDVHMEGLRFDVARNTWVSARIARDVSFDFVLPLDQFLDWDLPGLFVARDELASRLGEATSADATGFVDDLVAAARGRDSRLASLFRCPVGLQFSATDGGDRPRAVTWQMRTRLFGELLRAMESPALLREVAEACREKAAARQARRREALAPVLARYPGEPRRHRRAHWALVNLANCGQTVEEMGDDEGVLPRCATRLTPSSLSERYATADPSKLRFVLNDRYDINVLGDERYWSIIARYGFPPNHELLSGTRPIVAAGYLTLSSGKVVAIEDDGQMIPGKLPPNLPPMVEVLAALGFPLDREQVERSSRVVDWAAFAGALESDALADLGATPSPDAMRRRLLLCPHGERPPLVAAYLRRVVDESQDGEEASRIAAEALAGFRIINISGRDVASGDLPKGAELVDDDLAPYLVRKAARP